MICPICNKERFKCNNTWILKSGYVKRSKTCFNCGYNLKTIELQEDKFNKYMRLVDDLKDVIARFMKK